jgi:hypothetical protein
MNTTSEKKEFRLNDYNGPTDYVYPRKLTKIQKEYVEMVKKTWKPYP